ncbi:MAG: (d)CMP kinase [candidate division WOR-3 bacterium]
MRYFKVAVDGLSGSGKTTMAKSAARRLNWFYLETGSFYRAFTLAVLREKIDYQNFNNLNNLLARTVIDFHWDGREAKVYLNGAEVTGDLRRPEVDRIVSYLSEIKAVRERMVRWQRKIAEGKNVIGEGRDIGSVLFPDADLKVFVFCDLRERAKRRRKELAKKGILLPLEEIMENLQERDRIDSWREASPLVRLPSAIYIDTTHLTIAEEVEIFIDLIKTL